MDIVAYVYLKEEIINLKHSNQVKTLINDYKILFDWFNNFEQNILPSLKGTLPYYDNENSKDI